MRATRKKYLKSHLLADLARLAVAMAVFRDTDVIVLSSDSESEGGDGSSGGVSVPKSESIFTPTKRASSPLSIPSNSRYGVVIV